MSTGLLTGIWAVCVVAALTVLLFLFRLMRLGGCGYWFAFLFWGALSMWALLMFVSGKVHL